MKFAIVTDSHIGPSPFYWGNNRIMSYESERVVMELAQTINSIDGVSFVAQLGDMSQDDLRFRSAAFDRENYKRALWYFKQFRAPVYHTVGNHDRESLTYADLCALLGLETLHYAVDVEGYHCVYLYTRHFDHARMIIEDDQLAWLERDLAATSLQTLVFMHHPISDQDFTQSFWFKEAGHKALVENRTEVRAILEASGKVRGVFNGHMHRNDMTVHSGIPYITVQACVEDVHNTGTPSKAFALVTVAADSLKVDVHGADPASFRYPPVAASSPR